MADDAGAGDPDNPLMAPPIALPATKAIRVSAGWMSTDDAMIFGDTNVYTACWMMMVPTSATNAIHGLTNTPTSAASASNGAIVRQTLSPARRASSHAPTAARSRVGTISDTRGAGSGNARRTLL